MRFTPGRIALECNGWSNFGVRTVTLLDIGFSPSWKREIRVARWRRAGLYRTPSNESNRSPAFLQAGISSAAACPPRLLARLDVPGEVRSESDCLSLDILRSFVNEGFTVVIMNGGVS
jgi:hypothetical protein